MTQLYIFTKTTVRHNYNKLELRNSNFKSFYTIFTRHKSLTLQRLSFDIQMTRRQVSFVWSLRPLQRSRKFESRQKVIIVFHVQTLGNYIGLIQ